MIAADSVWQAGLNPPAVYQNFVSAATVISNRGVGFCDPQLMSLGLFSATAAVRCGVTFDGDRLLVRHLGWYLQGGH